MSHSPSPKCGGFFARIFCENSRLASWHSHTATFLILVSFPFTRVINILKQIYTCEQYRSLVTLPCILFYIIGKNAWKRPEILEATWPQSMTITPLNSTMLKNIGINQLTVVVSGHHLLHKPFPKIRSLPYRDWSYISWTELSSSWIQLNSIALFAWWIIMYQSTDSILLLDTYNKAADDKWYERTNANQSGCALDMYDTTCSWNLCPEGTPGDARQLSNDSFSPISSTAARNTLVHLPCGFSTVKMTLLVSSWETLTFTRLCLDFWRRSKFLSHPINSLCLSEKPHQPC